MKHRNRLVKAVTTRVAVERLQLWGSIAAGISWSDSPLNRSGRRYMHDVFGMIRDVVAWDLLIEFRNPRRG